jgi:glycosyltransferase involved in cell wall biosynthesis
LLWLLFPPVAHPQNASASSDAPPQSTAEEYRRAFAALKAVLADPRKLMVYCETETLAATYRAILGVDVSIGDGPNLAPPERDLPRRPRPGPTTIVCVGYANEAKGYNLLPNAIRQVVQARPDVRFMIHGSRSQLDANQDFSTFEALGHIGPQVVVNSRVLEDDEYLAWLDQADLLLLPYDPETYRSRGSGVFAEATSLGIPSIVTAGCAFASQAFAEQRAVAIERHDSDGVARAILRAIGGLPALAEKAEAAALASSQGTTGRYCAREALELLSNRIRNELTSPDRQ